MTASWTEMARVFGRIGILSFGGPAAQIALMHKELVEDRPWLSEQQYLRALSFCMLLPGPEAMQLATYAGWRLRGTAGGLLAGLLFVVPGALVIAALALAYGSYGNLPAVQALFVGIQATVVAIVISALRKVAAKALHGVLAPIIAGLAFIALFALAIPFPVVIGAAAIIGAIWLPKAVQDDAAGLPAWGPGLRVIVLGLALWGTPIAISALLGADFLTELGIFFSKLAVVTFGGAYAVLAYMTQTVVSDFGWISTAQMMDALGLAETTPGPLILVTQFVGILAGSGQGGTGLGLLAGAMVLWVTFVPCFIWIFAGAPMIEWIAGQPRLQGALAGITAAVVGVIANLSVWFAIHVFFDQVAIWSAGPLSIIAPDVTSINWIAIGLAALAGWLVIWRGVGFVPVLGISGALAFALHLI